MVSVRNASFAFVVAVSHLQAYDTQPVSAACLSAAYTQFRTGRYAESASNARACLKQEPSNGQARKILGLDLFMLGDAAGAKDELQRTVEMLPNDEDARYYLGRIYFTGQNMPAALATFQHLLEIAPNSVRGHNQLGQTYEALNQSEAAQASYEKAVSLDRASLKHSEWPYYNLGVFQLKAGRARIGAELLQEALRIQPRFTEAKIKLGAALSELGQTEAATQTLQSLLREEPDNADAHYQLGRLYLKLHDRQKAEEHFRRFDALRKK